jgi:hypothetical protein
MAQDRDAAGQRSHHDQRSRARAHADGEKAERARSLDEGTRPDVIKGHTHDSPSHDEFAAPGPGRRRRKAGRQCRNHAQYGDANAGGFSQGQRLDAEQRPHHHGVERQRRQRQAGAGRGRIADRDIIEDEEHPEEAQPEQRHRRPVAAWRPSHPKGQRHRQQARKTDAPAQDRQRDRIGIADEIAGDGSGRAAKATRDQCDGNPDPFAHLRFSCVPP